jgi:hypothetical protein
MHAIDIAVQLSQIGLGYHKYRSPHNDNATNWTLGYVLMSHVAWFAVYLQVDATEVTPDINISVLYFSQI